MKLHLPLSLLSAVLLVAAGLTSRAQAVEVPSNYTPHYLAAPDDLSGYRTTSGNLAFLLDGSITFTPSSATWWTSSQELKENGSILFTIEKDSDPYSLTFEGGANKAFYNVSTLAIEDIGRVTFEGLKESNCDTTIISSHYYRGGAINATTLRLKGNSRVTFTGNEVISNASSSNRENYCVYGGAICGGNRATITITETSGAVTFAQNKTTGSSSASSTTSSSYGGAIYGGNYSTISISSNTGDVNITDNSSYSYSDDYLSLGGAIYGADDSTISICDNEGDVSFTGNSASSYYLSCGGAIYGADDSTISICDNEGNVSFTGNSASASASYSHSSCGGAIYGANSSTISISSNTGDVNITENTASSSSHSYGGAISVDYSSTISISSNTGDVNITENTASSSSSSYGGAIYGRNLPTISICDNEGNVSFTGNSASSATTSSYSSSYGGAIYGEYYATISISGNAGAVNITGNSSSAASAAASSYSYGGAIYGGIYSTISICDNEGNVSFTGNSASASTSYGGAIYGANSSTISICDNEGDVSFTGNSASAASALGGAIYSQGSLYLQNNGNTLIAGNYEKEGSNYRLRSIYMSSTASDGGHFHLSAAAGKNIEFRDTVYIASGSTVELNADYTTSEGNVIKQEGDIIFTGAYTEAHLMEMKGGIAGTAEEILASRTSEVYAMTNLYGGRLRVENGAIYKGWGITVHEGSAATLMLKNGELNHVGYDITISSGSTLSALGESTLTAANLIIQDGGTMQLALDMSQTDSAAVLTTTGNLSMNNISFDLTGTEYLVKGDYKLLTRTEGVDYDISGWTLNGVTSEQLRWENGTLYYVGGHDWNHGVTDDDDISDLEEILGNLIINGGDVTLEAVVGAIQDAVDAGFGHGQGHIVINRGGIHISGAGDLDGHIIFNGNLKAIRKLFIEKDITGITIELGGNSQAENIVDVGDRHTMEIDSLSGDGSMSKTGEGEMVIHGNGHKVGGTLSVQEGTLTFTAGAPATRRAVESTTEVRELVVGNEEGERAELNVAKNVRVTGENMLINGSAAHITNEGTLEFSGEVRVVDGHLDNQGTISKVSLVGGKVSGSGIFAGLEMLGGELVVGNSPGLQTYTDDVELTEGEVTFSLADTETAATADTHGWGAAAYSTIDMGGNALTLGENVNFVLEIGGAALESLIAADDASLTFSLSLIQNIGAESLTLDSNALAALLGNTIIMITSDAEGLSAATLYLAGRDITALLSDSSYSYEGNTLVFKGTVTNDGSLNVPEPTTATLSLLALAGLAARRRRR